MRKYLRGKKIKLDSIDLGIIINGLVELRNKIIREERDPSAIDELILRLLDEKDRM